MKCCVCGKTEEELIREGYFVDKEGKIYCKDCYKQE